MVWTAAVVGLGRVSSGYERDPLTDHPRSHVAAIFDRTDIRLTGVCDSDPSGRESFSSRWGTDIPTFDSVEALLAQQHPDVVVVACSTTAHAAVLQPVIASRTRLIFCEKPFCAALPQAERAAADATEAGIVTLVNYSRRFDPRFSALKKRLNDIGAPKAVSVIYRKGLFNYGSHIIDLLLYLFGPIVGVDSAPIDKRRHDSSEDPSLSCRLHFASGFDASLLGIDDVDYELIEFDIFFPHQKFSLTLGGYSITEMTIQDGAHYPGYRTLVPCEPPLAEGAIGGLIPAYDAISALLGRQSAASLGPLPTADTAILVHRVLDAIVRSAASRQRVPV